MAKLYVVGTPIGNMEDVTLRGLRALREVGLVAAEDTRVSRRLLSHYDIHARLVSFNEHNQGDRIPVIMAALAAGEDVALVSDAGMPGVSDPGQALVAAAGDAGYDVVVAPGASAVTAAVAVSGLVTAVDGFVFVGFLPRKRGERLGALRGLARERRAVVAFEAPHRLQRALGDMLEALGGRRVAVCREMTKVHEEVFRGSVGEAIAYFEEPRGEFTLVVEGAGDDEADVGVVADEAAEMMGELRRRGVGARSAVDEVMAATGLGRREVYRMWVATGDDEGRGDTRG